MIKEFREFIARGNVVDLAVGLIMGVAFGAVVASLVNDIIMPIIGLIIGGINFQDLFIPLNAKGQGLASLEAAKAAGAPVIAYGQFINLIINFIIIAFVVFLLVKAVNRIRRQPPPAPPAPTTEEKLLMEIRDTLKAQTARR